MAKTLTVRLDEATARALEHEAKRTNTSRGEILRRALAAHLHRKSAIDAFGDVVGCMSGPRDLSTNKKYLKSFGTKKR